MKMNVTYKPTPIDLAIAEKIFDELAPRPLPNDVIVEKFLENRWRPRRREWGFTIVELIVVVTVIGLLAAMAIGAYNKVVNGAKIAKSTALISTLASAKGMFAADPATTPAMIQAFNLDPDGSYALLAGFVRVNGQQPQDEASLLALSGMPATVLITLGHLDDSSFGGTHNDEAPTCTGYGL